VFVEGRFRTREFETKDGQKRISLEITADNVVSLEARVRDEDGGGQFNAPSGGFSGGDTAAPVRPTRSSGPSAPSDDDLDDLPF